jgi:hypothetical protein
MRVAIVVDDDSRPTPVAAPGLHKPMQEQEIARRVGAQSSCTRPLSHWRSEPVCPLSNLSSARKTGSTAPHAASPERHALSLFRTGAQPIPFYPSLASAAKRRPYEKHHPADHRYLSL